MTWVQRMDGVGGVWSEITVGQAKGLVLLKVGIERNQEGSELSLGKVTNEAGGGQSNTLGS